MTPAAAADAAEAARLSERLEAFSELTDRIHADVRRIREAELDAAEVRRSEAASERAEAAIEVCGERLAEAHARAVLFEDLQRDWSDARYAAETDAQERLAEEAQRTTEDVGVVEVAGRREGLDLR